MPYQEFVFRPTRTLDGKKVRARLYAGQYLVDGMPRAKRVQLNTPDKATAEERLRRLIVQIQRRMAGLLPAESLLAGATSTLATHLSAYEADLKAQERNQQHINDTTLRIARILRETRWKALSDASVSSFTTWRAAFVGSAKTKKEYQVSLNAFLNWLVRQGKLAENPIRLMSRVETRGKQTRQARPFTEEELSRLLAVAGPRELVYLTLYYSGQRKNEVRLLRWADLQLEGPNPSAHFREETMKDREARTIPLPLELADALRTLQPPIEQRDRKVFLGLFPHYETFRMDLERAGIPHKDSAGRVVHFHSFRKSHASLGARYGVAQKATQEVLGHSDANMTANIYTEMPSEAIRQELAKLRWIGKSSYAHPNAHENGPSGPLLTKAVTSGEPVKAAPEVISPLKSRILSALDTIRRNLEMVDATGLEPVTPCV
jgi:integrase